MKNIRILIPVVMIVLMLFSCYSIVSQGVSEYKEYKKYCEAAEVAAKDKITVDVESNYSSAISLKKSLDLYLKWGQYYVDNKMYDSASELGEIMIEEYPKEAKAFEFLLNSYLKINDYEKFFDEYNHAKKLGINSDELKTLYKNSKYLYSLDYNSYLEAYPFSSGYARVLCNNYDDNEVNKFGFAGEDGNLKIKDNYKLCGDFNNDEVSVAPVADENGEAYFIDKDGNRKYVISPENVKVVSLGMYSSGVVPVYDGKNYYLCNLDSEIIGGPYAYLSAFNSDIGVIQDKNGWKIINSNGEPTSTNVFDGFVMDEKNIAYRQGCLIAKKGEKFYVVDSKGDIVSDDSFEDAKMFIDSFAAVKNDGKWGYIDNKCNLVIDYQFEDAKSFSNDLAAVSNGSLWGYIYYDEENHKPATAIEYSFHNAQNFSQTSQCAFVMVDSTWNLLKLYSEE